MGKENNISKDEQRAAAAAGAAEGSSDPTKKDPPDDLTALTRPITDGLTKLTEIASAVKDGTATSDGIRSVVREVMQILAGIVNEPTKASGPMPSIDETMAKVQAAKAKAQPPKPTEKAERAAEGGNKEVEALQEKIRKSDEEIAVLKRQVAEFGSRVGAPAGSVDVHRTPVKKAEPHTWPDDLAAKRQQVQTQTPQKEGQS
jgi:methyl-accepting chemotaxis protein